MSRQVGRYSRAFWWALAIAACGPAWGQAGTLVLADGKVSMVRGAAMYTVTPGVRIQDGDILVTGAKGQAQVQFRNGALLNAGPGTHLLVAKVPAQGEAEIDLLEGWIKIDHRKAAQPLRFQYVAPRLRISAEETAAVVHVGETVAESFVETGSVKLFAGGDRDGRAVKAGEFVVVKPGQAPAAGPRPGADFVKAMPRHFQDPLPAALADKFKDRKVEPKREHDVAYGEVEGWLKADLPARRTFVRRFVARARDPEFRAALVKNIRSHPEWDRILFPEKYETPEQKTPGAQTNRQESARP